ncbi:DUF6602 domain-containing protein [Flavobacterium subsaxonicum]|uniref:DUF6602 domain-containing protein n=1 Tax=Flavobacterium subsaxonicum WB 4.1-42 = DSM 21790 TaxID=1121898 RepID=A0A0A2MFV1_9FLAO|nr:DUF6602 domain-containing protein [Flavobacterium subsaxonicum]KGO91144.1 hypothetical protein Q766_19465 [Flavobacterium subsaxonicum WB 4.1-42 = DSM 21790]
MGYMYNDFLKNISQKFLNNFNEISTIYNFDFGDEFEIALCKSLRVALPNYYGICRGSIFTVDGNSVGDDIIIYDQFHFPTLRLLEDNTFAQKQQIPFEAVFAYIEAKNTLIIEGSGGNTIEKAWSQCQNVKKLYRQDVKYSKYSVNGIPFLKPKPHWPTKGNPIYTAIFSRGVRRKSNEQILETNIGTNELLIKISSLEQSMQPDLIIADYSSLIIPAIGTQIESPFFMEDKSFYSPQTTDGFAYGLGLSFMFYAFDNIKLGKIGWPKIISNGLNMHLNE